MVNKIHIYKRLANKIVNGGELAHHGVQGMHWGIRRYQPYGEGGYIPKSASGISSVAKKKEPVITNDVIKAFNNSNMKVYGLENRLKTKSSIERKIEKDQLEGNNKAIKDAVRYTGISSNKDFTKNYYNFKNEMLKKGYKELICKNFFKDYKEGKVKHKSVQSIFVDAEGYPFEIQFHTKESQNAKNLKVPLYEEIRNPKVSKERAKYLENEMVKLAEKVPYPKNVMKIVSHT